MLSSLPFPSSTFFISIKRKKKTPLLLLHQQQQQQGNKFYLNSIIITSNNLTFLKQINKASPFTNSFTIDNLETDFNGFQSISHFNHHFKALVTADEFQLASNLYFNLPSYGLSPDNSTYSTWILYHCKKNELNEAIMILNHVLEKGFQLNVATFTTLINSFCKKGRIEKAFEVFGLMSRVGCQPTVNTYNCLLKGLCYSGKVDKAYELLEDIKNSSTKPDVYSYAAVMDGLCKVSRSSEALELLFDAIEMGLSPNVVTYNTLFNGYFKEGMPLKGIDLLKHMADRNCTPDYVTYSTLLHGLLKWGEIRESFKIYKEMVGIGFKVDERMTNKLLRGLCRRSRKEKGMLKNVNEVLMGMRNTGSVIYPCAFDLVIEALCNGKESKKAVLNLYEMVKMGYSPNTITFDHVVRILCVEGDVDEAISVLFLIEETDGLASYVSFNILINELNRRKMLNRARVVYGAALKRGIQTRKTPGRYIA